MEPMGLVAWVIVGLIAGWLASQVVPSPFGILGDTFVGMIGALLGGFLFRELGETGTTGLSVWSVLIAFVGAVVCLIILRAIRTQKL